MPRHVPDDFSFLPTVDSTDEEIMEQQAGGKSPRTSLDAFSDQGHGTAPSAPEESWEAEEPPTVVVSLSTGAAPPPAETVESDTFPAAQEQDGHALWEEFIRQDQPQSRHTVAETPPSPAPGAKEAPKKAVKEPAEEQRPLPTPRAPEVLSLRVERGKRGPVETPRVSFGDTPAPPSAKLAKEKDDSPATAPVDGLAAPSTKPFIAPKPPPEEPVDPDTAKKRRWEKLVEKVGIRSLGWSVGVHLLILLLGAFIGFNQVVDRQVDFLPGGGSAQAAAASAELTQKVQNKKNPWLKTKPQMRKVTVQSIASDIVLPEMPMDMLDMSSITNRMDISKAGGLGKGGALGMGTAGSGGGFGSGIGKGGKFSFVGQTALGKRVVFVVDVSGSMSAIGSGEEISRFDLLKKELIKSVNQMPMNTQYQILFFSDFAWPHDKVDSRDVNALSKYKWEIDSKDYRTAKIPPFRFIQATPFSLRETADIIQRSDNPGGTNWGSGLLMALNANPKPDVIFFMTDGMRSDEQGWVDVVTSENRRRLPMTAIYTSAMQQPDAARELDDLARRNNGRFTVVLGDGKIVTGEDFFKRK